MSSPVPTSVLHVLAPARYGGLERVVTSLVSGQTRAGLDARVLAIIEPGESEHPFVQTLARDRIHADVLVLPPRRYLAERSEVAQRCARARPSVVHLHGARPDVLVSGVVRRAGFAVVSTVHGFTGGDLKNRFYEYLQRRAFRRMDAVVAVSRPLARELAQGGVPESRLHLVPNAAPGVSGRLTRAQARAELGIPADERVAGWVGRLTPEKGGDVFVEALGLLDRAGAAASIIGSGPQRVSLESLTGSFGTRVRWHGEIANAGRLLSAFDVLVMSSRTEGTPMVLFEAIQSSVPIIATAVGGIPDVISSEEAILVPSEDARALADAIRAVFDDPAAATGRARRAKEKIEARFSVDHWVESYSAVYRAALDGRR